MKKVISIFLAVVMTLSLSNIVLATDSDIPVNGHIGTTGTPSIGSDSSYDITYTTAVHWWVTQANPTTIVNGDSSGPNASVVNKIQNNNTATQIKVSLKTFTLQDGDAKDTTMQGYLDLHLTGDLAANGVGSQNLNTGYTAGTNYTVLLNGGEDKAWKFGFNGIYNAPTLTKSYAPKYTMTLGFAFATEAPAP